MVVHPDHPGLSAEVVVDHQSLKEYDDDADGDPRYKAVTKYVQVDVDSKFAVRYTIPQGLSGGCGVQSRLKIDGKGVSSRTHPPQQLLRRDCTRHFTRTSGHIDGRNFTQDFRFAQLSIGEDEVEVDAKTSKQLKNIGVITLSLTFIDSKTTRDLSQRPTPSQDLSQAFSKHVSREKLPLLGVVSEKSLKGNARSHQASLSAPKFRGVHKPGRTATTYKMGDTFVIFHFKYRSLAALKSLQVIPPTPNLPPDGPAQGVVGETVEEEPKIHPMNRQGEDVAGTGEIKLEVVFGIKREATEVVADDEVTFVSSKRLKKLPTRRHEVIELE